MSRREAGTQVDESRKKVGLGLRALHCLSQLLGHGTGQLFLQQKKPSILMQLQPEALFIMEKTCSRKKGHSSSCYPGWVSQLFLHFLIKLGNCLNEKQKVGSAKRVTYLTGSPSWLGILFSLCCINTLVCPARSTRQRPNNQTMHEFCRWLLAWAKGHGFFS